MTNISDERIKELREWLKTYSFTYGQCAEILTLLDDYSSLRAENERLQRQHETDEGVNLRLCEMHTNQQKELHNLGKAYKKAEAQLAKVCERNKLMDETFGSLLEKNINLEEQLAKQVPLIQAVMEVKLFPAPTDGRTCIDSHEKIIREALKLREGKK